MTSSRCRTFSTRDGPVQVVFVWEGDVDMLEEGEQDQLYSSHESHIMQNVDRKKVRVEERGQEEEDDGDFKVEKTVTPQGTQASIVASPKEAHDPEESPGLGKRKNLCAFTIDDAGEKEPKKTKKSQVDETSETFEVVKGFVQRERDSFRDSEGSPHLAASLA